MPKNSSFFGFDVHCALHWILFFFLISVWFWAFVKTIMDFQIWYSMWFSVFPIFQSSSHESSICSTCHRQYRID